MTAGRVSGRDSGGVARRDGPEAGFAGEVLLQFLDLDLRLGEPRLADLHQTGAFLEIGEELLQRKLVGLHRFHDRPQLLQRLLERDPVRGGFYDFRHAAGN